MRSSRYNYCRPPLGLCYLAGYLNKYSDEKHEISIVDTLATNRTMEEWIGKIAGQGPDIVGITAVTPTVNTARRMAAELRKRLPGAVFIGGGPHATVRPDEMLDAFDAVVSGEGEVTFLDVVSRVGRGEALAGIPGAVVRRGGGGDPVKAPSRGYIEDMDSIPVPARELLDMGDYYHSFPYNRRGGLFTTMFTARGCPRDCYFCANRSLWNGRLRYHSLDYAAAELETLTERQNVSLVFIDDDDFLSNRKRAMEMCGLIAEKHPALKWICHCCVSGITGESLAEMKRAGCVEIQIGVESGDESILEGVAKSPAPEKVAESFALIKKHGINSWATFIIGHPKDTPQTVRNTISFACRINPTYSSFIIMLPFPGSRVFDEYREAGYLKTLDWDDYSWHGEPVFETPSLSRSDMTSLRAEAMKRFYLRPGKIASYVLHALRSGSAKELLRNMFAWVSLVKAGK